MYRKELKFIDKVFLSVFFKISDFMVNLLFVKKNFLFEMFEWYWIYFYCGLN